MVPFCPDKNMHFIIFSDSLSSLEALSEIRVELGLVQSIIKDCTIYTHLATAGKNDRLVLDINPLQQPGQ